MLPDTAAEWIGSGIITAAVAIVSLLWKIRHEREQAVEQAKKAAVDASSAALGVVQSAMVTQGEQVTQLSERLTEQDKQVANLNVRVTTLDQSHRVALNHIADRESWARRRWEHRPKDLPQIPAALVADVIASRPDMSVYYKVKDDKDGEEDARSDEPD